MRCALMYRHNNVSARVIVWRRSFARPRCCLLTAACGMSVTPLPNPPPQGGREPAKYAAPSRTALQGRVGSQFVVVNLQYTPSLHFFVSYTPPPSTLCTRASPLSLPSTRLCEH